MRSQELIRQWNRINDITHCKLDEAHNYGCTVDLSHDEILRGLVKLHSERTTTVFI